jgi:membrane protease YdiL (CAAX protease family)
MSGFQHLAVHRPYLFVVGLFIVENALPIPLVVAFRVLGIDPEPLRLIIPIVLSVFMMGVIWVLGWPNRAGLTRTVHDVHLYWYPVALAFVPVLVYGTIEISTGPLVFYTFAVLFTGVGEEAFARGIALPALLPRGKWLALLFAAVLFSIGHFTNLFFEDFGPVEMAEKLMSTFSFAILYGALFIRTKNLWPLIILHAIHDYSFVTSGTAGPFTVEPVAIPLSIGLAVLNIVYGVFVAEGATWTTTERVEPSAPLGSRR